MKNKPGVELKDGQYYVDGKPFFVFSGEMHYFRIPADQWVDRLKKAKQLGLNTIASYIPWVWHEPVEGQVDLSGKTHPQRNLIRFLELVAGAGMKFFARPGPVTHGELKNDGLPAWLVEKPGGINVRNSDGQSCWCPWLPSFFKPVYQDSVKAWYARVIPILSRFQASHGGPVIQVQLDNEIHMINWLGKLADYNPETTRRYQAFLKNRYASIGELNRAYGTSYAEFSNVPQPEGFPEREAWTWLWDWALYYRDHYAGYFEYLARETRAHGLETPVSANVAQFVDFNMYGRGWESIANTNVFRDFSIKIPHALFGGAFQMRHLDFENFHDIIYTIESLRSITDPGMPVNCAELQVGVINDRPRIYPSDVELNLKTAAAHGLNAINGYMTFGGQSPNSIQLRGNYHEWQAPVDSRGRLREHAEPLARFGKFIKTFGKNFSASPTMHDVTLAFDGHYYFTEFLKGPFYDRLQNLRNMHFFDGSARVLSLLGYSPDLLDLERATLEEMNKRPLLWLFSLEFMSRAVMEKLVQYVRQGGRLVINPYLPQKNEVMQADDYLIGALGLLVDDVRPMSARNQYRHNGLLYLVESEMTIFSPSSGKTLVESHDGKPCAVSRKVGQGEVMVIGFGLYHQYDYLVDLVLELTQGFGMVPRLHNHNWEVHAALRGSSDGGWLYLANFHDSPRRTRVALPLAGNRKWRLYPQRGDLSLPNRSAYFFPVNQPLTATLRVETATCEIIQVKRISKPSQIVLTVRGLPEGETEMVFNQPVRKAMIDGKSIRLIQPGEGSAFVFNATGCLQALTLYV